MSPALKAEQNEKKETVSVLGDSRGLDAYFAALKGEQEREAQRAEEEEGEEEEEAEGEEQEEDVVEDDDKNNEADFEDVRLDKDRNRAEKRVRIEEPSSTATIPLTQLRRLRKALVKWKARSLKKRNTITSGYVIVTLQRQQALRKLQKAHRVTQPKLIKPHRA